LPANIRLLEFELSADCDIVLDLSFSGDFDIVLRKHSKNVQIKAAISVGRDEAQRRFGPMKERVEWWRSLQISADEARQPSSVDSSHPRRRLAAVAGTDACAGELMPSKSKLTTAISRSERRSAFRPPRGLADGAEFPYCTAVDRRRSVPNSLSRNDFDRLTLLCNAKLP
jgi:hypothetical protein